MYQKYNADNWRLRRKLQLTYSNFDVFADKTEVSLENLIKLTPGSITKIVGWAKSLRLLLLA